MIHNIKYRILIVDDHELVRKGLRQIINAENDMQVCGEATNVNQAKKMCKVLKPDLAIVDISLPDGNGLDLIKTLLNWQPELKILVLSMYDDELFAERALNSGALGYINKQDSAEKILEALTRISTGKIYVSSQITERLLKRISPKEPNKNTSSVSLLSDREIHVYEQIGNGKKTSEIAKQLNLSVKTVETYRRNIKNKLKLTSGIELARSAVLWSLDSH